MSLMKEKYNSTETKAFIVGSIANFIMACSGWYVYHLTNAEALHLDGNFSFISFLICLCAVFVNRIKDKRSHTFPAGLFVLESLYSIFRAIMIIIVIAMALVTNGKKVLDYYNGLEIEPLMAGPISYYAIAMALICFGTSFYYKKLNKSIDNLSSLLKTEAMSLNLDGIISIAAGIVFFALGFVDQSGKFGFIAYIGDSILVLILCLLFSKQPFNILKEAFTEMATGRIANQKDHDYVVGEVKKIIDNKILLDEIFVSKTGSNLMVFMFLHSSNEVIEIEHLTKIREKIRGTLAKEFPYIDVEFIA